MAPPQATRERMVRSQIRTHTQSLGWEKAHTDLDHQILSKLVIEVLGDHLGYIPAPNLVPDAIGVCRKQPLDIREESVWHKPFNPKNNCLHVARGPYLSRVHLVDDGSKCPHVHRARVRYSAMQGGRYRKSTC
jgi:hypothetical protein